MSEKTMEFKKVEGNIERLMCVHEGICPDCGRDLTFVEVAGTRAWLGDNFIVLDSSTIIDHIKNYNDEDFDAHALAHSIFEAKLATGPGGQMLLKDIPAYTLATVWIEDPDGYYKDIGILVYRCPDVRCHKEYETYAKPGGDWTLAEGGWNVETVWEWR